VKYDFDNKDHLAYITLDSQPNNQFSRIIRWHWHNILPTIKGQYKTPLSRSALTITFYS